MTGATFYVGAECLGNAYWTALRLVECVGPWEDAWLWVDGPDTWKRQGLHLFTRLRMSYSDHQIIQEAPVHRFAGFEAADLTSFVTVLLLNEWSFFLVTSHDYGRVRVSQSSGVEVWVRDDTILQSVGESLAEHGIDVTRISAT